MFLRNRNTDGASVCSSRKEPLQKLGSGGRRGAGGVGQGCFIFSQNLYDLSP